jgi:hypothetical protein
MTHVRFCDPKHNSVMLTSFPRNRPALRLNSYLSAHFIPAMIPGKLFVSSASISLSGNSITACIFMKTIIKPQKPFFPSCIMDLGALASPEYPACGDTPTALPYNYCADFLRPRLVSTGRLPRHGSLVVSSLTTENRSPGGQAGPCRWGGHGQLRETTPCSSSDFVISSLTCGCPLERAVPVPSEALLTPKSPHSKRT